MKKIIKKSITITEMIIDDNGETFIIDRKYSVKSSHQSIIDGEVSESWKKLDQIYRQEIAKEAEEYKKKNPFPANK